MKKRGKRIWITALGLALAAAGLVLAKAGFWAGGALETLPFVLVGIGCGAFGNGLSVLMTHAAIGNDPDLARQIEVEAKDERNTALAEKAKGKAYDAMVFLYAAVLLAFALMKVELAAILLLVCAYLFVVGYGVYVRLKLEREM